MRKRSFRNGRMSRQVADELERLIPQEFPNPGDRWPTETQLADRFRVSRVVVREAVKLLEERGVVEVKSGRGGTITRRPTLDRVSESLLRIFNNHPIPSLEKMERMLELREVLEETAAGLAAVRASQEDLEEIEEALSQMERTGSAAAGALHHLQTNARAEASESPEKELDFGRSIDSDLRFHLAVAKAAHNEFFEVFLQPLTEVIFQQMGFTVMADQFSSRLPQHRKIFEEIRTGNSIGARQAARRLMRATLTDLRTGYARLELTRR